MSIPCRVDTMTLDELALILLPRPMINALGEVDIEYSLWERRRMMNTNPERTTSPVLSAANQRFLPVVVLGNMVALPSRYPLQLSILQPGRSHRAIHAARDSDREVVLIFVPEREIGPYRSGEPQPLPSIGVMARLTDIVSQPDGVLELVMELTTRAKITARRQHNPYYLATCVPHPDPEVTLTEIPALMSDVKAQVAAMARTLAPQFTPDQATAALTMMQQIDHPGELADFITASPIFTFAERLTLLNTLDPVQRLQLIQHRLGALAA